jgi:hypothetical protein
MIERNSGEQLVQFFFWFLSIFSDSGVYPDRFPLNWATAFYNAIKSVARKQTCGATVLIWRLVSGKKKNNSPNFWISIAFWGFFAINNKTACTAFLYFVLQNRSRTPASRLLMFERSSGEQEIVSGSAQLIEWMLIRETPFSHRELPHQSCNARLTEQSGVHL